MITASDAIDKLAGQGSPRPGRPGPEEATCAAALKD